MFVYLQLSTLAGAALVYIVVLVTIFFMYERRASGAVLVCLLLLLAEGVLDPMSPLRVAPADRCLVLTPLCLNLALTWAAFAGEPSYIREPPTFDEKSELL